MICDMADVTMTFTNEEEKNAYHLAPTPSAAHNPDSTMTGDGGEFQETKKSKTAKMSKTKGASETSKMSEMPNISKNGKSTCSFDDLAKPHKTPTKPKEKVAGPEIAGKCSEMLTF